VKKRTEKLLTTCQQPVEKYVEEHETLLEEMVRVGRTVKITGFLPIFQARYIDILAPYSIQSLSSRVYVSRRNAAGGY
jgi:hypothetical protein